MRASQSRSIFSYRPETPYMRPNRRIGRGASALLRRRRQDRGPRFQWSRVPALAWAAFSRQRRPPAPPHSERVAARAPEGRRPPQQTTATSAAIVDQSASDLTVKALELIPNSSSLTQFQKTRERIRQGSGKALNQPERDAHHSSNVTVNTAIDYRPTLNAREFLGEGCCGFDLSHSCR